MIHSQGDTSWPVLEPSYIHNFNDFVSSNVRSVKNFFEDRQGRIWLDPRVNDQLIRSLHLFVLNDYDFIPVDVKHPFLTGTMSFLAGLNEAQELVLYNSANHIFKFNPDSKEVKEIAALPADLPEKAIRNVTIGSNGDIFVLATYDHKLLLYQVDRSGIKELARIDQQNELQFAFKFFLQQLPLLENERGIWFVGNTLPLYHYDLQSQTLHAYSVDELADRSFSGYDSDNMEGDARIMAYQDDLILCFPKLQHKLFRFDLSNARLTPYFDFPLTWEPHDIAKDQSGNLLFLFKDPSEQYRAILEDHTGARFDYTSICRQVGKGEIVQMKSRDFFREVIINRERDFFSAGVRQTAGLRAFPGDRHYLLPMNIPELPLLVQDRSFHLHRIERDRMVPVSASAVAEDCRLYYLQKAHFRHAVSMPSGEAWVLHKGEEEGLVVLDTAMNSCKNYPMDPMPERIARWDDTTLLLYGNLQLSFFDTRTGRQRAALAQELQLEVNPYPYQIMVDKDSILWFSNSNRLLKIDLLRGTQKVIGREDGFEDFRFHEIYQSRSGKIYFGSATRGVQIYDPISGQVKIVDYNLGLADNSVRAIQEDDAGFIWVGTVNGISLLDPEGNVLRNFFEEDGLPDNEIIRNVGLKTESGQLLFSTRTGVVMIEPEILKAFLYEENEDKPFLTQMAYYDPRQQRKVSVNIYSDRTQLVSLPADHRYLQLKFAIPNLVQPTANRFAYMLEGKDEDWTFLGSQHELNLSHLPAGKYRMLIKGADYLNNWTRESLVVQIHAREFFYKQDWFYALCGLFLAGLAGIWIIWLRFEKRRLEKEVDKRTTEIRTDKELIEQQAEDLQRANQMQSRFFTNISHELRTPVTLIGTPVEQILQKYDGALPPALIRSLHMVRSNTQKLNGLVEEILELTKLESGNVKLKETPIPIRLFIRQLFSAFENQASQKHLDYTFISDVPSDLYLSLDRSRLAKIVNNLLSNALKFTPENETVQLHLSAENQGSVVNPEQYHLRISVADSGRGIPPEDLPRIFDRYFQTGRSSLPTEGGTGIGLALSRELTRVMRGELTVNSDWGKGSTFTLSIPGLAKVDAPLDHGSPAPSPAEAVSNNLQPDIQNQQQILIVEDNPDMQELLLSILSDHYPCELAGNGAEAWKILQDKRQAEAIKLIISDIMMPEMDGYDLLERIKATPHLETIPVIMLTARTGETDKLRALRMGVDDYLGKPFSVSELLVRSQNLLRRYQLRRQYQQEVTVEEDVSTPPDANQTWLLEIESLILEAIHKKIELNVAYLSHHLNLGDRQLLRRLKALTGLTVNQYMLEIKLQYARNLLEERAFSTIAETAYASGFKTPAYFSRTYKKRFGKSPKEYFEALG
ncbi:hypothetical protein CRP01_15855 [Flavilitoribacter nigricans DSM 23189 = NBRC 102662]|uniref:histidine kinase n=2 Tax=Flavilitoribacter TaxID=2762562 RepID=A0A2D0NBB7_FLAN2|nr:hypothetical protein CRP01_15855 [Flavilitoribacter nigricans DSM 23189 = NBRC 102662]